MAGQKSEIQKGGPPSWFGVQKNFFNDNSRRPAGFVSIVGTDPFTLLRLSFKGTVDALRQWRELFENPRSQPRTSRKLRRLFYQSIATDPLLERPERSEPRAVKRRPKNFRLLTKPRHQMVVERCRKWSQKPSNNALN
jgi:hypothetical protein